MRNSKCIIVMLVITTVLLTGCWDSKEIKSLAIVMALGIDKDAENKGYRVSLQIANVGEAAGSIEGGSGYSTPITVYTTTGRTLLEAIRKTSKKVPRELYFSHLQLVIIGESLAKKGISNLFDFFERTPETRLTSMVLIAERDEAKQILETLTPIEKLPSNSLSTKMKLTEKLWSENTRVEIDDIVNGLGKQGKQLVISGVRLDGDSLEGDEKSNVEKSKPSVSVNIGRLALFKDGKLMRWLPNRQARGIILIQNKMKGSTINLNCQKKKNAIGIEILRSKTNVTASLHHGKPMFHVNIHEEGIISEVQCALDLNQTVIIKELERQWRNKTETDILAAVKLAQNEKSDVLGFGEVLNLSHPKVWNKWKHDWNHTFSESKVDVTVNVVIHHSGMRTKTYHTKETNE
ncbi:MULTISPECIES: Ger(x)C family spore germination protein [unclassified Bacillus cereus group]|uniref:Ger(x)C family spore germination protein n=1 Tax=unclassified Bacillus cereus group TaxID=2750818 RepID=UPI003392D3FF